MRLCYFIPGSLSCGVLGAEEMDRRSDFLRQNCLAGEEVEVRDAPDGPASVESAAEEQVASSALIAGLPRLEAEGFDAAIIGCFGDPGLAAGRELVKIPLVGPAQASIHLAAQLGDRFGILTVLEEVVPSLRRLMRAYGMEGLMADLRAVQVPVLELRGRRDEVLDLLSEAGRAALAAGADALVLGCMTMGFLGLAEELQERLAAPVVNPVLAALWTAETMVAGRLHPSRRAYPRPPKPVEVPFSG
ncbi:MAG: aspartate/glutamate racemase family protein [Acidobacteriota bacterium]